jgi:hypothetical protein
MKNLRFFPRFVVFFDSRINHSTDSKVFAKKKSFHLHDVSQVTFLLCDKKTPTINIFSTGNASQQFEASTVNCKPSSVNSFF